MEKIKGLEFAQELQPELTKILVQHGFGLIESKELGKKMALIGQAIYEVANQPQESNDAQELNEHFGVTE